MDLENLLNHKFFHLDLREFLNYKELPLKNVEQFVIIISHHLEYFHLLLLQKHIHTFYLHYIAYKILHYEIQKKNLEPNLLNMDHQLNFQLKYLYLNTLLYLFQSYHYAEIDMLVICQQDIVAIWDLRCQKIGT